MAINLHQSRHFCLALRAAYDSDMSTLESQARAPLNRWLAMFLAAAAISASAAVTPLPGVTPQRAPALAPLPVPVAVRVTDTADQPVRGAKAYFSAVGNIVELAPGASGECWIDFMIALVCRATTDAEGIARFPAMVTRRAEAFTARVAATNDLYPNTVNYGETILEFVSDPLQDPARLTVFAGDNQRAVIGMALSPITMRLEEPNGEPRRNAVLWYSPMGTSGGFEMPLVGYPEVRTDDNGLATLPKFTAPWGIGEHRAEVRYFDTKAAAYVTTAIRYATTNAQGGTTLDMGDLWWGGPSESGWGLSVHQQGDRLFNVWFVYDDRNRPTWFVMPGGTWSGGLGGLQSGEVYWTRGTPWHAYDATRLTATAVGPGSVAFRGPEEAWASLNVRNASSSASFSKRVTRQPFGESGRPPQAGVNGLWWGGPSQNGWGVAIHEHASQLFIVWFTYDDDGAPTWFVMPDGTWMADGAHRGTMWQTRGRSYSAPLAGTSFSAEQVGSYRLRFTSKDTARMDVTVGNRSIALELQRQVF